MPSSIRLLHNLITQSDGDVSMVRITHTVCITKPGNGIAEMTVLVIRIFAIADQYNF